MKEIDRQLDTALWWQQLQRTNNDTFLPLFFDRHRYLVLKGGGGSGKSIFAGRKVLERVTTEPNHRWLVVRKVAKTIRESCFEQLKDQARLYYPDAIRYIPKGKSGDMYITFRNGSEILFTGMDDEEKLKSFYNATGIWIEEASEFERGDFNQLDIRMRTEFPYYLQMILSFNPISITHWLKDRFFDRPDPEARTHESTYRDNRFLPESQRKVLEGFKDTDEYYYQVYCLNMWGVTGKTVFDGKAVSKRLQELREMRAAGERLREMDGRDGLPHQSADWFAMTKTGETPHPSPGLRETPGDTFPSRGRLTGERADSAAQYIGPYRGLFEYTKDPDGVHISDIRWVGDESGPVTVYRLPEKGRPYVIGGDTAGEGSDWFTAQVLDNVSGEQVCVLRHQYDEDEYTRQIYCLGKFYGGGYDPSTAARSPSPTPSGVREVMAGRLPALQGGETLPLRDLEGEALVAIETNFSTYPVKLLGLMGYRRQYVRQVEDSFDGRIRHAYGFRTDGITRPVIISELVRVMRDHIDSINDEKTLEEMLSFVRNEKLRPEAEPGAHDDLVMALAIAHYVRPQQRMEVKQTAETAAARWTPDMWEDYRNGTPAQRAEMVRLWGRPR